MGSNGVTGNAALQMADNFSKITIFSFGGAEECACCTGSEQICSACAFFFLKKKVSKDKYHVFFLFLC
jgi:hypothetical protein